MDAKTRMLSIAAVAALITMGLGSTSAFAGGALDIDFSIDNFDSSMSTIDNEYWPLTPGAGTKTFTYIGDNDDECVINTITIEQGNTRMGFAGVYSGITAQIVEDREWAVELEDDEECDLGTPFGDDDLTELTFDWYAQDIWNNIWYMGEISRSFDPEDDCPPLGSPDEVPDECFEGSWEAGQYGPDMEILAEPGIVVPSDMPDGEHPLTPGTYYMQEVAEGAEDMAKILRLGAALEVEDGILPGEYDTCRKVKEWTALEPGHSVEHKWYCLGGNGLVLIEGVGGGPTEQEVLVLITP